MNDIDRRVLLRALIEDPTIDHDAEIGQEIPFPTATDYLSPATVQDVADAEHGHPDNLLAQKAIIRRELMLALDLAAVVAKFEQETEG